MTCAHDLVPAARHNRCSMPVREPKAGDPYEHLCGESANAICEDCGETWCEEHVRGVVERVKPSPGDCPKCGDPAHGGPRGCEGFSEDDK